MDFTFDDQQIALRDAVHKFLMVEAAPEKLREIWETTSNGRSKEMRAKLAEQGVTALSVPQGFGGLGLGDLEWALVQQELGYFGIADSLTDSACLAVDLIAHAAGADALRQAWLPRVAAGTARIAVGHPINPWVADAESADLLLLWHDDEIHALPPAQAQLTASASIDLSRRLYRVEWTPSDATRVCAADAGCALWAGLVDRATLAVSAQLLGLAQRMLDLGVDHAAQRKQFGKPIGSFQAIKHHMADIAVAIEFAEPVVHRAACAMACDDPRRAVFVSHARLAAGAAARLAARNSLQVHGAMGTTWEADLQIYMKRAWALDATWGNPAFHKARVADAIFADGAVLGAGASFVSVPVSA